MKLQLPKYGEWKDTYATLHRVMQITGKLQLRHCHLINHHWNVTYFVGPRGLHGQNIYVEDVMYRIDYDFFDHKIIFSSNTHKAESIDLVDGKSVQEYYQEIKKMCEQFSIPFTITDMTVELQKNHPFSTDVEHKTYNKEHAHNWFTTLQQIDHTFNYFRSDYLGKSSPSHFFWGSFDLAVTRFNGELAELKPDADSITKEAYSHQVTSAGFWPGEGLGEAAFYSYAAPAPDGYEDAPVSAPAYYHKDLGEWLLPYSAVEERPELLLKFLEETYAAVANNSDQWPKSLTR